MTVASKGSWRKFMALPRKVREAAEKADAIHSSFYENKQLDGNNAMNEPVPDPAPTVDPQDVDPAAMAVTPPIETPEPPKEEPWEQRYRVIEGKYRAEVPRLASENKELKNQIQLLAEQVESLKSQATQAQASSLISDADREKYGDDLLDVIQRATKAASLAKDQEIAELKRQFDSVRETTAKDANVQFYDRLNQLAPNWVNVNSDENFLRWLDEYDELSGHTRQDLLSTAEQNRDAELVARFFNKYETEVAAKQNQRHNPAAAAHQVPDSNKRVTAPPGKRFFTRKEIADFYAACRAGRVSAKDQVAMEAEIHSASIEGRIR